MNSVWVLGCVSAAVLMLAMGWWYRGGGTRVVGYGVAMWYGVRVRVVGGAVLACLVQYWPVWCSIGLFGAVLAVFDVYLAALTVFDVYSAVFDVY